MLSVLKVGIVGGRGNMGSLFARELKEAGLQVEVSDLNSELSNAQILERNDIIIFSLPLAQTPQIIASLAPLARRDQLLVDITSLKMQAVEAMMRSEAAVLGLHPMFGPAVSGFKNQLILVCRARESDYSAQFLDVLAALGARLKETTPEKHDKIMSVVQSLNHLGSIITAAAMSELGADLKDCLEYASPAFKIRMDLVSRILSQDPGLYADIAIENQHTVHNLEQFILSAQKILELVKAKDRQSLQLLIAELGQYFAEVKAEGMQSSNKLIETLFRS